MTSASCDTDQSIVNLRARVVGQTASLYGFDIDTPDPLVRQMGKLLKASITTFLAKWFGLRIIPFGQNANIVIANEAAPPASSTLAYQITTRQRAPTILVLCSHSSRFDHTISPSTPTRNIGFAAKPVGPLKLARALLQCFDGIPPVVTPSTMEPQSPLQRPRLSSVFEELSSTPDGGEHLDNTRMASDSKNARKAIESPNPAPGMEKCKEYPFPIRVPSTTTISEPPESRPLGQNISSPMASAEIGVRSKTPPLPPTDFSPAPVIKPRLLLVDDNLINLTLLRTYMRKRKYDIVDEAENGLEAVNRYNDSTDGYDIIFMDISMPILDGFGASRQIRAIEASRQKSPASDENEGGKKGEQHSALIIALTGLAGSQDQSEALSSGIDLFLTKPVSFKEVGTMLNNWEANR